MHNHEAFKMLLFYIENKISDDIGLDELSQTIFLSKYHFHRLFKSYTGKSIMDYIKIRKLNYVAFELQLTQELITSIAYKYGFNSQDSFIRAFRRYFGVTPGEYRKNRIVTDNMKERRRNWEMIDWSFYERIKCSNEDKYECLELIDKILAISKIAHKYGLLRLGSEKEAIEIPLFKKGVELVLQGTDPVQLRDILEKYVLAESYSNKELLKRILVIEGLSFIQLGDYPWEVRERLCSFLGEGYIEAAEKFFNIDSLSRDRRIQEFQQRVYEKGTAFALNTLEVQLSKLDNRSIQRLLREIDIMNLYCTIFGLNSKILNKIFECLPGNTQWTLVEIHEMIGEVKAPQIADSQSNILQALGKLRCEGDIS